MKKILLAVFALSLALGSSTPVYALTQTTTIPISLTIVPAATVSATSLNFGSVTSNNYFDTKGTASITVNVANGLPYTVTLDTGLHSNGAPRKMSGTTSEGTYYLRQDAALLIPWGDKGFANTYPYEGLAGTGSGADQTITVYGFLSYLTPNTNTDTLTDTITVTVNY